MAQDEVKDGQIVLAEEVRLGTLSASSPADVVKRASGMATELKAIIADKKLYNRINGKDFVRVEGWTTLGAMLGVLPRERSVMKIEDGYEAYVELVRATDGAVIGGASALCTHQEKNWGNRDEYAVRSMAITRATGKAFRLGFSWIMTLAGYEATPAEEMPTEPEAPRTQNPIWTPAQVKVLIDSGAAANDFAAKGMLALSNLKPDATEAEISKWGELYRKYRPDPKAEGAMSAQTAARHANEEMES